MIRLAWRQMRLPTISTAVLLAALVAVLVAGAHAMTSFLHNSGLSSCLAGHDDCSDLVNTFRDRYGIWTIVVTASGFVPVLAGLFWGAPLIAREVEQGTHRLVWSQSVSRRTWLTVRVGLYLAAAAAVGAVLTWLFTWWYGPLVRISNDSYSRIQPAVFETRGVVLVATMFYALALGAAAGTLIRRTVPAMAVALGGCLGERIVFELVRGHLLPPRTISYPAFTGYPRAGLGDWTLGLRPLDQNNHDTTIREIFRTCPTLLLKGPGAVSSCPAAHGVRSIVTYQPLSRFWPLQGIETGILVTATVLLLALAAWWTLRRIS
jgi:hypothetical protein